MQPSHLGKVETRAVPEKRTVMKFFEKGGSSVADQWLPGIQEVILPPP